MHTAKELHDWLEASNLFEPDARQIILRALSLLASVEDEDGIVRELRRIVLPSLHDYGQRTSATVVERAAALIVSQRESEKRKDEEIASLKKHAEAMANSHDHNGDYVSLASAISAYRAAHPKDAP